MTKRAPQNTSKPKKTSFSRFKQGSGSNSIPAGCLLLKVIGPQRGVQNYYADDVNEIIAFLKGPNVYNADKLDDQFFTKNYWETIIEAGCGDPRQVLRADATQGSHDQYGRSNSYIVKVAYNCVGSCADDAPCVASGESIRMHGCHCKTA